MDKIIVVDGIILFIMIAYPFIFKFIERYLSKKGEGQALKEDSRKIEYEKAKGQNLATKEDIEGLTRQLENVKNEISFENQRKHDFINQRTERLINVLYLTEKLNGYQATLFYSLHDKYAASRLLKLVDEINETLLQFLHESRMLWITFKDEDLNKRISNLITAAQEYAVFMCYIASNATTLLNNWSDFLEMAEKNDNNNDLLKKAIEHQNGLDSIKQEFEKDIKSKKDHLYDCQIKYLSKLNILFSSDFHLKV